MENLSSDIVGNTKIAFRALWSNLIAIETGLDSFIPQIVIFILVLTVLYFLYKIYKRSLPRENEFGQKVKREEKLLKTIEDQTDKLCRQLQQKSNSIDSMDSHLLDLKDAVSALMLSLGILNSQFCDDNQNNCVIRTKASVALAKYNEYKEAMKSLEYDDQENISSVGKNPYSSEASHTLGTSGEYDLYRNEDLNSIGFTSNDADSLEDEFDDSSEYKEFI